MRADGPYFPEWDEEDEWYPPGWYERELLVAIPEDEEIGKILDHRGEVLSIVYREPAFPFGFTSSRR